MKIAVKTENLESETSSMTNSQSNVQSLAQEAIDENTTGARLKEIAGKSTELARLVASNHTTPPELLSELANHSDFLVREHVTANPNTSFALLKNLASHHSRAFFANPITPLLLLENPNFLYEIEESTLIYFLYYETEKQKYELIIDSPYSQVTIPTFFLERLVKHPKKNILALIAKHPQTPINIIEELAKEQDDKNYYQIRENVGLNPNTPIAIIRQFAEHPAWQIRGGVARNHSTPVELLEILAKDKDRFVRKGVAENSKSPIYLLEALAQDKDYHVRYCVKKNPNTPVAISTQIKLKINYM
jgi:hypothetical protein